MNDTHCTIDRIQSLIDGELTAGDRERVESHLRACAACRAQERNLRAFDAALRDIPLAGVSAGFTRTVMARLDPFLPAPRAYRLITWIAYQAGLFIVLAGACALAGLFLPDQVDAGKGIATDALQLLDTLITSESRLIADWAGEFTPSLPPGAILIGITGTLVLIVIALIDRNFSKRRLLSGSR